jgi:hypothetical protein
MSRAIPILGLLLGVTLLAQTPAAPAQAPAAPDVPIQTPAGPAALQGGTFTWDIVLARGKDGWNFMRKHEPSTLVPLSKLKKATFAMDDDQKVHDTLEELMDEEGWDEARTYLCTDTRLTIRQDPDGMVVHMIFDDEPDEAEATDLVP